MTPAQTDRRDVALKLAREWPFDTATCEALLLASKDDVDIVRRSLRLALQQNIEPAVALRSLQRTVST